MDLTQSLGLNDNAENPQLMQQNLHLYINLKLASCGQPPCSPDQSTGMLLTAHDMLRNYLEKNRQFSASHYPADQRIQDFLNSYFADLGLDKIPSLPGMTFELDRHGIARELSIAMGKDEFHSDYVASYRIKQGVLHNPVNDRRTTKGSFHIAAGGLPVPGDKKEAPKKTFAIMLEHAMNPPDSLQTLPYCSEQPNSAKMFASLLLRPIVCPEIQGVDAQKTMEIRFFAPGSLVSNLDFVESIFGNGGNPGLPQYDSALDVEHWTGHSGCIILAPHLVGLSKQAVGLPHWDDATQRQRDEGMCWKQSDELYNEGQAFKIVARDASGVIVSILADNYFGYCKKEVKTHISYSANLFGIAEEEHSGGALAFRRRNHGDEYGAGSPTRESGFHFDKMVEQFGDLMDVQPEGYAIDKRYPELVYVPQVLRMNLNEQAISWTKNGVSHRIRLQPGKIYIQPNGYKIEMLKHPGAPSWRLVGTDSEGTFCHKPSTVSGGGKSEISKSLEDAVLYNPLFINNLNEDLSQAQAIFDKDYTGRFKPGHEDEDHDPTRQVLSSERSLGSVIKLLTVSSSHTQEYIDWLKSIPSYILALVFFIKRFYRREWGQEWRKHLTVDIVDGAPGHELKLGDRKIIASYLRIGFDLEGEWRVFKVRQDFMAAEKIQMEDDISASVVVPTSLIQHSCASDEDSYSLKLVSNCESRLFQRPDDAVLPGYDTETEHNMALPGNFLANYEPLNGDRLAELVEDVLTFSKYSPPMRDLLSDAYTEQAGYVASSAHPRMVNGEPSKNPRYLETRADLINPVRKYIAEIGARLHRKIDLDKAVCHPVNAVLTGRRNNPAEPGIRPLAVYNPIHYQQLPELFMDFISSLTGKSPSTTGAGSEGALTKGPFNALRATVDLNNALVSYILTGYAGFSSAAGFIGSNVRVNHDVSLLIPEIWTRLSPKQRQPDYLIEQGYLEKVEDIETNGQHVLASRLGYRITEKFVHDFMGKIFDNPMVVFTKDILKPETQGLDAFVDGVNNIVETQQRVAQQYFDDGSIDDACPPLHALLHIMAHGDYQGKDVHDPEIRKLFGRDYLLKSDWYVQRLQQKQQRDIALWQRHVSHLQSFAEQTSHIDDPEYAQIKTRLQLATDKLKEVQSTDYVDFLKGTIGADAL